MTEIAHHMHIFGQTANEHGKAEQIITDMFYSAGIEFACKRYDCVAYVF